MVLLSLYACLFYFQPRGREGSHMRKLIGRERERKMRDPADTSTRDTFSLIFYNFFNGKFKKIFFIHNVKF